MYNPQEVFRFIAGCEASGTKAALVTIAGVTGSSVRRPGTHLAVNEHGAFAGSFSGGCIEAAIAAEAQAVIAEGRPRMVRYGTGSPYIDIRLPCGGGLDLLFNPLSGDPIGNVLLDRAVLRRPLAVHLPCHDGPVRVSEARGEGPVRLTSTTLSVTHAPPLRLVVAGHSAAIDYLRDLASAIAVDVVLFSPDKELVDRSTAKGAAGYWLKDLAAGLPLPLDRWTAFAMLFHDHDWEPALLSQAVRSEAFFVGAMGSRQAHANRCAVLADSGMEADAIARIVSPVGLIPSMRDPETLAISILAQAVGQYNELYLDRQASAT